MPDIDQGQIISVALRYTVNFQENLLTHHYYVQRTSGFGNMSFADCVDEIVNAYNLVGGLVNVIVDVWSSNVALDYLQAQIIYPTRYAYIKNTTIAGAGTVAGQSLPQNVAVVLSMRTDEAGRDQVANKHIGGVPPSFITNGSVNGVGRPLYETVAGALGMTIQVTNGVDTFDLIPVIYHRSGFTTSSTITNFVVQDTSRIMRRRTVGLGT